MNRKNWIDWAKVLGILMVVMGHSSYANPNIGKMIFIIHMPLFFFISGYLFKLESSYKSLNIKIWNGLFVPYILYNLIFAGYFIILAIGKYFISGETHHALYSQLWHTLFGVANGIFDGPTWFLLALIWCKYITYIFHVCGSSKLVILIFIAAFLFWFRTYSGIQYPFAIDCALGGLIWFEAGYVIKQYCHLHIPSFVWFIIVPISLFISYLLMADTGAPNYMMMEMKGIKGVMSTGIGLLGFFGLCILLKNVRLNLIVLISNASIVIMCLHMMIQGPLNKIIPYQGKGVTTFIGDLLILLSLSYIYIYISKHFPKLTGNR